LALAVDRALEPPVLDRQMSRRPKAQHVPASFQARSGAGAVASRAAHITQDAEAAGGPRPVSGDRPKAQAKRDPKAQPKNDSKHAGKLEAKGEARNGKRRRRGVGAFEDRIGYRFKDAALLDQALTHISALGGSRNRGGSYQRLEFLGDHVLGLVISDMLFRAFPRADEGEMSRRLADLVRKEACADVARAIDLGSVIRLGVSENNAGGRGRTAILADVCEAMIGAVFVDGGYEAACGLIIRLWEDRMRAPKRPLRDAKTMLQEWAQARGLPTPTYREVERRGPDHSPEFRVQVELPGRPAAEGVGRSKRAAEQEAAAAMLGREGVKTERVDG
jgi:ribonuclease-3